MPMLANSRTQLVRRHRQLARQSIIVPRGRQRNACAPQEPNTTNESIHSWKLSIARKPEVWRAAAAAAAAHVI